MFYLFLFILPQESLAAIVVESFPWIHKGKEKAKESKNRDQVEELDWGRGSIDIEVFCVNSNDKNSPANDHVEG